MVHLSADKLSEAECIRDEKWFPEFPQTPKVCVLCERKDMWFCIFISVFKQRE